MTWPEELRKIIGARSVREFARDSFIPYRTLMAWLAGENDPAPWVKRLLRMAYVPDE